MSGAPARRKSVVEESVKLFVSPASFTSFGPWMLLQHFEAKHEVVNVQVLDDTARESFASNFSPLIPSVRHDCARIWLALHHSPLPYQSMSPSVNGSWWCCRLLLPAADV